jgi:hypothetical protein
MHRRRVLLPSSGINRRSTVTEFVSLNGIMEAPGGEKTHPHTGWTFDTATPAHGTTIGSDALDA